MMTETEVSSQLLGGCYNMLPNKVLNRVLDANLRAFAETISFDERAQAVAVALQQTLPPAQVAVALARIVRLSESERVLASTPLPCFDSGTSIMGSSDVGDVANIMPTSMLWGCAWPVGVRAQHGKFHRPQRFRSGSQGHGRNRVRSGERYIPD